jgi:hypothetical protein
MFLIELQYMPPVAFFQLCGQSSAIELDQHEHYTKGSYRNRCTIAAANGPLALSVPLQKGKHQQRPIREARISYDFDWQHQHLEGIRSAYGRAPFFEHYAEGLFPLLEKRQAYLFDFNLELLHFLLAALQMEVGVGLSQGYAPSGALSEGRDWRGHISPKKTALFVQKPYVQVFADRFGFLPNLSIIDLLFCMGPAAKSYL